MKMCGFHKDCGQLIVDMSNMESALSQETTSNDIILKLSEYTSKALDQIQTLGSAGISEIRNTGTREWLQRLATAEGLVDNYGGVDAEASI